MINKNKLCKVQQCKNTAFCKELCVSHYNRYRKYGDFNYKKVIAQTACKISQCDRPHAALGFCNTHLARFKRNTVPLDAPIRFFTRNRPNICTVFGCKNLVKSRTYCGKHYHCFQRYGDPNYPTKKVAAKGKRRYIDCGGYITISKAGSNHGIKEHRHIMEQILGRSLLRNEIVHHKNGIRTDNDPSNLELWSYSHPPGQKIEDKVIWARQIIKDYGNLYPN